MRNVCSNTQSINTRTSNTHNPHIQDTPTAPLHVDPTLSQLPTPPPRADGITASPSSLYTSPAMDALLELLGAPVSAEQKQHAVDMVRRVVHTGACEG